MINVMCLQLCLRYPHKEYISGAIVNSTHYIGVDESQTLSKSTIDKIASTMTSCHRKNLDQVDESTVLTYYVSSFSHVTKVENFTDFANTKKVMMIDGICLPYIHAQETGEKDD